MKTLFVAILVILATVAIILCKPKQTPEPRPGQPGGTYCVDVGADVARVEEAFGDILKLRDEAGNLRPATTSEIESAIFAWVEGQTHEYERRKNMAEFTPPPFGAAARYALPSPTPTNTPDE